MSKYKKETNRRKHQFLLTFFPDIAEATHKEVNGFILKKYFSGNTHQWEVQIYTPESWQTSQDYLTNQQSSLITPTDK